jgi:hypothetical protein
LQADSFGGSISATEGQAVAIKQVQLRCPFIIEGVGEPQAALSERLVERGERKRAKEVIFRKKSFFANVREEKSCIELQVIRQHKSSVCFLNIATEEVIGRGSCAVSPPVSYIAILHNDRGARPLRGIFQRHHRDI